jgi:hypothetical protein
LLFAAEGAADRTETAAGQHDTRLLLLAIACTWLLITWVFNHVIGLVFLILWGCTGTAAP